MHHDYDRGYDRGYGGGDGNNHDRDLEDFHDHRRTDIGSDRRTFGEAFVLGRMECLDRREAIGQQRTKEIGIHADVRWSRIERQRARLKEQRETIRLIIVGSVLCEQMKKKIDLLFRRQACANANKW